MVLDDVDWRFIGHLTPHQHGMSAFMHMYEIHYSSVPDFNRDDFIEYYWLYPHEVVERLTNGDKSKDDLPRLVTYFMTCQQ